MPTYEYRCTACKHDFEKFQRMSDEPHADCPACGAPAQRRLSGGAGLLFKGSGFYITDYRGESYRKAQASDKGGESAPTPPKDGGGKESKTDAKPSTAAEKSAPAKSE